MTTTATRSATAATTTGHDHRCHRDRPRHPPGPRRQTTQRAARPAHAGHGLARRRQHHHAAGPASRRTGRRRVQGRQREPLQAPHQAGPDDVRLRDDRRVRHRRGARCPQQGGDRGPPPGPLGSGRTGALHRARPEAAALGGRLHLPRLRGRLRAPPRPAAARAARPDLPARGAAGHHAPGPGRPVAARPRRLRGLLGQGGRAASRWTRSPAAISTTSPHSGSYPGPCLSFLGGPTAPSPPASSRRPSDKSSDSLGVGANSRSSR